MANTYLSTFQVLGSLGLMLGTIGLAVVLVRNVIERRPELALLSALGFRPADRSRLVLSENAFLLAIGLGVGTALAILGVAPMSSPAAAASPPAPGPDPLRRAGHRLRRVGPSRPRQRPADHAGGFTERVGGRQDSPRRRGGRSEK